MPSLAACMAATYSASVVNKVISVEVACAPCTICQLHTSAICRLHHVQYVDCTQVQYINYKCALDALMVKDVCNVDRLVPREHLTQLV